MAEPFKLPTSPWSYLLRGAIATAFGALMLVAPTAGLAAFILALGIFALVDGAIAAVAAFVVPAARRPDWTLLAIGFLGIIVGLLFLARPMSSAVALAVIVAAWIVAVGAASMVAAIRYRREIEGEWLIVIASIFPLLFGGYLLWRPDVGVAFLPLVIGSYALAWGLLLLVIALQLWRHRQRRAMRSPEP